MDLVVDKSSSLQVHCLLENVTVWLLAKSKRRRSLPSVQRQVVKASYDQLVSVVGRLEDRCTGANHQLALNKQSVEKDMKMIERALTKLLKDTVDAVDKCASSDVEDRQ